MPHKIYHTEGFILGERSFGEANKIFRILTPDLGLVGCLAQGIRFEKSKLRFALVGRRFVKISLVRGKEYWRLVHVEPNRGLSVIGDSQTNLFLAKMAALLSRFIHGEKGDPQLYKVLEGASLSWVNFKDRGDFGLSQSLETLTMMRILAGLGYRPSDRAMDYFIDNENWKEEDLADFKNHLPQAVRSINAALHNSQL